MRTKFGRVDNTGGRVEEVETIYVSPEDRYIVSLVVGYSEEEFSDQSRFPNTPLGAFGGALDLTRDEGSPDTTWFVYDRKTGEMHEFEQDDAVEFFEEVT